MAPARRAALALTLLLLAGSAALTAAPPAAGEDPCPGFTIVPAQGPSCPVPGGWLVRFEDGSFAPTHGPDYVGWEPFEPWVPEAAPSDPVCVLNPANDYYQYVVYAVPNDRPNRYSSVVASIRSLMRTVDGQLLEAAMESGGNTAHYKVHCTGGDITVANVNLGIGSGSATYSSIVSDLRNQGYSSSRAAYWVWYDGPMSGVCGQGTLYGDSSLSSGNSNNFGNDFAILYATTSGCTHSRTWMHENGHTTGAVQNGAPKSSNAGHCSDGKDIMCYKDGGSGECTTGGFYCENTCFDFQHFDCNHDSYFHTSPPAGSWLATHWNLGNALNRFYTFAPPGNQAPAMVSLSCAPDPSSAGQSATCTFHANDDSAGVYYTVNWGDGSPTTRVPSSGHVAPNVPQNAAHAWAANGGYTVSVAATDDATPPLTGAPATFTKNVGPLCSLDRTGSILMGLLGQDVQGVSARSETNIPSACWGRAFSLDGAGPFGMPVDFDLCWRQGSADLQCHASGGGEEGTIPSGATEARIVLWFGALAQYQLKAPV